MNKLNYLKSQENSIDHFDTKNDQLYETNELIDIFKSKWSQEKIKQANYTGQVDRYIAVTNLYSCPRLVTYTRLDYNPDISKSQKYPHTILINSVGQYVHDYLAKLLDIYNTTQIYLSNHEYKVRGKCDGLLYNALLEFKTVEELPKNPDKYHLLQMRILFDLALSSGYDQINVCKLVYIKRNLKQFKEFNFHIDIENNKQIVLDYYKKALNLYNCLCQKKLSEEVDHKDCFFCNYEYICKYSKNYKPTQLKDQQKSKSSQPIFQKQKLTNNENMNITKTTSKGNSEQNKNQNVEWLS